MAHLTTRYRRWIVGVLALGLTAIALSVRTDRWVSRGSVIIDLLLWGGATLAGSILGLYAVMVCVYRKSRLDPGEYNYELGKEPRLWHRKMGALRILEILTPRELLPMLWRVLGGSIGRVACAGYITEPDLVSIGDDTLIGLDAIITPHSIELRDCRKIFILYRIAIGRNCVIGMRSIILPGAEIADNTIVPAGQLVPKRRP